MRTMSIARTGTRSGSSQFVTHVVSTIHSHRIAHAQDQRLQQSARRPGAR